MKAGVFVVALCAAVPAARADFKLSDAAVEIGLTYDHAPTHFPGQRDAVIGTGLHVTDRNGVFAKVLMTILAPADYSPDSPYSVTTAPAGRR